MIDSHANLWHAVMLSRRSVPLGDGIAKEVTLRMSLFGVPGVQRVRITRHNGFIVTVRAYVRESGRLEPMAAHCLDSVTLRDRSGKTRRFAPFPEGK